MLVLIKLLWLVVIALLVHRLIVVAVRLLKHRTFGQDAHSRAKRFDAKGADIEDGDYKELK